MFGPAGLAYVYLVYGMYDCLNVVTGEEGAAGAVLLRAIEPIEGSETMVAARKQAAHPRGKGLASIVTREIASGPGRLCAAYGIDRSVTGLDLCDPANPLRLEPPMPGDRLPQPIWTPRVGVAYAAEPWASLAWRLVDRGSPALSGPAVVSGRPTPDPEPNLEAGSAAPGLLA